MLRSSRIPFMFGIAFTAMGLVIGCFAARVTTFTCIRDEANQQGMCRLEQSTVFLPWNKTVVNVQLNDIQRAESVETGVDSYSVVLLHNDLSRSSLYKSEYSENSRQMARQINSFLANSKARGLSMREGGGIGETIVLLGFCGFGLLFTWAGAKSWHRADAKMNPLQK